MMSTARRIVNKFETQLQYKPERDKMQDLRRSRFVTIPKRRLEIFVYPAIHQTVIYMAYPYSFRQQSVSTVPPALNPAQSAMATYLVWIIKIEHKKAHMHPLFLPQQLAGLPVSLLTKAAP